MQSCRRDDILSVYFVQYCEKAGDNHICKGLSNLPR